MHDKIAVAHTPLNLTHISVLDPMYSHGLGRKDLIHQVESLVHGVEEKLESRLSQCVAQFLPESMACKIQSMADVWKQQRLYSVYKDHEVLFKALALSVMGLLMLKILNLLLTLIVPKREHLEEVETPPVIDKRYTDFETFPVCTGKGKGDAEEFLMLNSYKDNNIELPSYGTEDLSILGGSTPIKSSSIPVEVEIVGCGDTGVPVHISESESEEEEEEEEDDDDDDGEQRDMSQEQEQRSNATQPISSLSSFEKVEAQNDDLAMELNRARSLTPTRIDSGHRRTTELSPSRKLVYKKSSSILTAFPKVTSETTVGDVTHETVYSQGFSSSGSGDSSPAPSKPGSHA